MHKKVAIIMGSGSDAEIMRPSTWVFEKMGIEYDFLVVSAHRSPEWMFDYARTLDDRGVAIVIAGAGGAAHLPGMMAALTTVPVIGVPVRSRNSMDGLDSLLSIVQMPNDVPVATVAIDNAHNAAILAAQILAIGDAGISEKLKELKIANKQKVEEQNRIVNKK